MGTEGMIDYSGFDHMKDSGKLLLKRHDYETEVIPGFEFECTRPEGIGPASVKAFIAACNGEQVWNGCDVKTGFKVVQVIEAMYRSAHQGVRVNVL